MQAPGKPQFTGGIPSQHLSPESPVTTAIGNVGRAIGNIGSLADDLNKEQEHQYRNEAELLMTNASRDIAEKLAANRYSPDTHVGIAEETLKSARAKLINLGKYSPAFRKEMEERTQLFIDRKLEQIGTNARLMQIENGKILQQAKIKGYLQDERWDEARAAYNEGIGQYWPQEYSEAQGMELDRMERNSAYQAEVRAGNADFFDQDLPISEGDKARFKDAALTTQARMERDDLKKISDAIDSGEIVTKDQFARSLEAAPNVSEETAKKALSNWDKTKPLSFDEEKKILDQFNGLFDDYSKGKITREEYARKHHQLESEVYAMGSREGLGAIKSRIYRLDPAAWGDGSQLKEAGNKDIDRKVEQMGANYASTIGFVRKSSSDNPLTFDEKEDAQAFREITEAIVKEWANGEKGKRAMAEDDDALKNKFKQVAGEVMTGSIIDRAGSGSVDSDYYNGIIEAKEGTILPKIDE